jgi:uncharacterized protein involved in cysteine biosynthesis
LNGKEESMAKKGSQPPEKFEPKGTLVVVIIFLITLIALWGSVYWILLSRGMTL